VFKFGDEKEKLICSFCGKNQESVKKLVAGPGVYICDECIELCNEIIAEDWADDDQKKKGALQTPKKIHALLSQFVIGQERAKMALSVAVYNHYKRIRSNQKFNDVEIEKSNILLIGPTGSGKTLLARVLAKILGVPFAISDATTLTEAGYVGEDVENILLRLIQNADYDTKIAEQGIVYIDEIDKISRKGDTPSITRDVSGEGVQQALLKILEGTVANVPPQGGRKHPHQEYVQIDTTNILFIVGGAFNGLDKLIEARCGKSTLGFGADIKKKEEKKLGEILANVTPDDLIKYGLIPEFVGRLPIIGTLDELAEEDLIKVLTEPKNALTKQYSKMFELDGVKLRFTDEALAQIAKLSVKREAGARGLRAIIEDLMMDVMYEIPSKKNVTECVITEEFVTKKAEPIITYENKKQESA